MRTSFLVYVSAFTVCTSLFLACGDDGASSSSTTENLTFTDENGNPIEIEVKTSSFKDSRDGEKYSTVTVDGITWMAENLRYAANGSYDSKDIGAKGDYGRFYSSATAHTVCPDGWHLPTSNEWQTLVSYLANHPTFWDTSGSVSKALADKSWRVEGVNLGNEPEHFNQTGFSALPTGFVHDYPLHAGGLWEHWKEHESAIYWCADFNNEYPKPAPVIDTANISPDPYPAWNYGWPDSIYPQPYIFEMNIHSDPSISSLADLHFCAVRCVKN